MIEKFWHRSQNFCANLCSKRGYGHLGLGLFIAPRLGATETLIHNHLSLGMVFSGLILYYQHICIEAIPYYTASMSSDLPALRVLATKRTKVFRAVCSAFPLLRGYRGTQIHQTKSARCAYFFLITVTNQLVLSNLSAF